MELADQQERRKADLHWLAGFFDGEGCLSIVQYKQRRFTQFAVSARLINTDVRAIQAAVVILGNESVPHHVGWSEPSGISRKRTGRITISGYHRVMRFLDVMQPYLRLKHGDAVKVRMFSESRISSGKKAPYSDEEIDIYMDLRDSHGYTLRESSETTRKTLIERRYSPTSDRKTESAAETTAPA